MAKINPPLNHGATLVGFLRNTLRWAIGLLAAISIASAASAAIVTSNGTGGGLWSSTTTWAGGAVPTAADDAVIANGDTVTIDTAAVCTSLTVGQGTSGVLEWESTTARTLTASGSATIAAGGTFRSNAAGTVTTHVISIAGNLTNSGTIDFSTNTNLAGASITFTGAGNATWTGNGNTNLRQTTGVTLSKGTNNTNTLEFTPGTGTFTVLGANAVGFLTITNGTFKISGANAFSNPVFNAVSYSIPATGGIWLNNANATIAGQNGSPTNSGLLRLSTGIYNVGTISGNVMGTGIGCTFIVEGGTMNLAGRLTGASTNVTYTQSAGTVNVATAGNPTVSPSFGFTGATGVLMNFSSGTINLVNANTLTTADYNQAGTMNFTGGTLNLGTAATAVNFIFRVQGQMPAVVIDNTTTNKTANLSGQGNVWGNLTINTGTTLNTNAFTLLQIGPTITNNGAITVTTTNTGSVNFAGQLQTVGAPYSQTYTGTGTCGAALLRVGSFSLQNPLGVTLGAAVSNLNIYRINAFFGTITNSNKLAIGNADAVALVIQRGAGSIAFSAGSLDVAPTFSIGTGGLILVYAQSTTAITTGPEIPATRTVLGFQIINPTGVTLAGGALTATNTASGLLLSSGVLTTSAANLLTVSGALAGAVSGGSAATYVNGPLARVLPASLVSGSTFTFPVGKGSFKMLELVNPTTNAGGTVTVQTEVFDADSTGTGGIGFSDIMHNRYWSAAITAGGANFTNTTVRLTEAANVGIHAIGQSATQAGAYDSIGGAVAPPVIGPSAATTSLGFFALGVLTGAPTITGTITVGAAGTFTTITSAVSALNTRLITRAVTLSLIDAVYAGETFPITLNANAGSSAANTVTIKPAPGVSPSISGLSATALIVLNGMDYVTIDGSNTVGGTTRDMTLTNTSTSTASAVIWGQTVGTGDGATNNTIRNLNLAGNATTTTLAGVGFGSSTISSASLGTRNDNNRVQNNNITTVQFGIYSQGASATNKNVGTVITGNTLGGGGLLALGRAGIFVGFDDGVQVTNNTINNVTASNSADVFGIALGSISISATAFTTNDEVVNATVTGNFVGTVLKTDTFSAAGISYGPPGYGTTRIVNNVVSGVNANGTAGDFAAGIYVGGATAASTRIYFNSVSMTGARDAVSLTTSPSFALAVLNSNPLVDIRDNVLFNTQTSATVASLSYAIGLSSVAPFTNITSDYNDLFTSGANSGFSRFGSLSQSLGFDRTTLPAWQAATGKDANSLTSDPLFNSTTNLLPLPSSLVLDAGTSLTAQVSPYVDITGATRIDPPSMGAYEAGGAPPPANDICSTATVVTITGGSATVSGNSSFALDEGDDASCAPSADDHSVWWTFTTSAAQAGLWNIDTCTSGFDTVLAIYNGTCGALTELPGGCNDNATGAPCGGPASAVTVTLANSTQYWARVSSTSPGGAITMHIIRGPLPNDLCAGAITVACGSATPGSTVGATLDAGLPDCTPVAPSPANNGGNISVTAPGVWYRIAGTGLTVTADVLTASYDTKLHVYSGSCASLNCVTANDDIRADFHSKVAFQTQLGVDYFILVSGFGTATGTYTLNVVCDPTPGNDNCATAIVIGPSNSGSIGGTTVGATGPGFTGLSNVLATCATNALNPLFDVWYSYLAPCSTNLTLSTCGAFDTLLSVHSSCPTLALGNQVAGACNDNGPAGCTPGSRLVVAVTAGNTYLIRVAGNIGQNLGGGFTLVWSLQDSDGDGTPDGCDLCPFDPLKIAPGVCGCGVPDIATTYYADSDGDGFGNPAAPLPSFTCIPPPPGYVLNNTDCDDTRNYVYPGAPELCDGLDNDCDFLIDEGVGPLWYPDLDGDGHGDPNGTPVQSCTQPSGYVLSNDDCDDSDNTIYTGAPELCDFKDNDCDLLIDEGGACHPVLILGTTLDLSCLQPGATFDVTVSMQDLNGFAAAGYQAFLHFDPAKITFTSGSYTAAPFGLWILTPITATGGGDIDLAAGIDQLGGQSASSANALLATLHFTTNQVADCSVVAAAFRPHSPPSRLTNVGGQEGPNLTLTNPAPMAIDGVAPVITCPPDVTVECPDPTDPGATGTATALDNCDPLPVIDYTDAPLLQSLGDAPAGWVLGTSGGGNPPATATAAYVSGPATPPAGSGSARLAVGANGTSAAQLRTAGYDGALLADLTELAYHAYRTADGAIPGKAMYLTLNIDLDDNGSTDDVLVFDPQFQGGYNLNLPIQGPPVTGVWQTWDALAGGWWSANSIGGLTPGAGVKSLRDYLAAQPGARLSVSVAGGGSLELAAGFGGAVAGDWDNFDGSADAMTIGVSGITRVHDFSDSGSCLPGIARTWHAEDCAGNESFCTQLINVVDTTAPTFNESCPRPTISVNANAGGCTASAATVNAVAPTADDDCDPNPAVVGTRSDALLLTDPYPGGTTTITWTVTDACGNSAICLQDVVVSSFNQVLLDVQLSPTVVASLSRCITFQFFNCTTLASATVSQMVSFSGGLASGVSVLVPCSVGPYDCLTARDALHTLRRTLPVSLSPPNYTANFTGAASLTGGNLNDDDYIDILDFGTFAGQYNTIVGPSTCATLAPHSDVDGDGLVFTADFTFIQINFLLGRDPNCCGLPNLAGGMGPITRISVAELWATGQGQLTAADLNGDGWLDQLDVAAFLEGARPTPLAVFDFGLEGSWFAAGNWGSGAVPDGQTNVVVPETSTVVVDQPGAVARSVTLRPDSALRLIGNGTLAAQSMTVSAGATLELQGELCLLSVRDLTLEAGAMLIWNGGVIQINGGAYHVGDIDLIVGNTPLLSTLRLINGSITLVTQDTFIGMSLGDQGRIEIANSTLITHSLFVGFEGLGWLDIGTAGLVRCDDATIGVLNGALGDVTVGSGAMLQASQRIEVGQAGEGMLHLESGTVTAPDITIGVLGRLDGSGRLGGTVYNAGSLAPAPAPAPSAALSISGAYVQAASGGLEIALGQTGQVQVRGAATLGGTLTVTLADGWAPALGQRYEILTAGQGVTQQFTTLHLPQLGNGLMLQVAYERNRVSLVVKRGPTTGGAD